MNKFDIFISHASEDKKAFVKPLAFALSSYGVKVWYDEFTLKLGDSLSRSIDRGLAESNFGLIILSPAFFAKSWTEYELRGLTAKEIGKDKVILPIWHNVDQEEVLKYSPPLADKFAISTNQHSIDKIALKVIEIIRPDLFTKIHKRLAFNEMRKKAEVVSINPQTIKLGPPIHKKFPPQLISRIRLIRAALLGVDTHSMKYWVDGFRGDSHPSEEVTWWEHVAACYNEYVAMADLTDDQYELVFKLVLSLCSGSNEEEMKEFVNGLPNDAYEKISKLVKHTYPVYDIEENFPDTTEEVSEDWRMKLENSGIYIEDYSSES